MLQYRESCHSIGRHEGRPLPRPPQGRSSVKLTDHSGRGGARGEAECDLVVLCGRGVGAVRPSVELDVYGAQCEKHRHGVQGTALHKQGEG